MKHGVGLPLSPHLPSCSILWSTHSGDHCQQLNKMGLLLTLNDLSEEWVQLCMVLIISIFFRENTCANYSSFFSLWFISWNSDKVKSYKKSSSGFLQMFWLDDSRNLIYVRSQLEKNVNPNERGAIIGFTSIFSDSSYEYFKNLLSLVQNQEPSSCDNLGSPSNPVSGSLWQLQVIFFF